MCVIDKKSRHWISIVIIPVLNLDHCALSSALYTYKIVLILEIFTCVHLRLFRHA